MSTCTFRYIPAQHTFVFKYTHAPFDILTISSVYSSIYQLILHTHMINTHTHTTTHPPIKRTQKRQANKQHINTHIVHTVFVLLRVFAAKTSPMQLPSHDCCTRCSWGV